MQFVTVRDFRSKSSHVWERVKSEKELVVTSNGRPVAILSGVDGDHLEDALASIRSANALTALNRLQARSVKEGRSKLPIDKIDAIISDVRKARKK